jgi:hypothetical protein
LPVPAGRDTFGRSNVGAKNPDGEQPDFFRSMPYHGLAEEGRSPGLMERTLRGCVLAAGTVRKMWRQSPGYIGAADDYSWTRNGPAAIAERMPFQITTALRYMTRNLYVAGGTDNTRLSELHSAVLPRVRSKPVSVAAGSKRGMPTVRNRLTSFGARVPPINQRVAGAYAEETHGSSG